MAVLKASYRNGAGVLVETSRWYIDFRDHRGKTHRVAAFKSSRAKGAKRDTGQAASSDAEQRIGDLVECRKAKRQAPADLLDYFKRATPEMKRIRAKLEKLELLDAPPQPSASKKLADVLAKFKSSLESDGVSEPQRNLVAGRAARVFTALGYADLSVKLNRVDVKDKCAEFGKSAQTHAHYIRACKQLTRWAVAADLLPADPLAALSAPVNVQQTRPRRALTPAECRELIEATSSAPARWGMTGPVRALLYRLALETGLRANELRTLTKSVLRLDGAKPTVTAKSKFSKNKQTDDLPLKPSTAAMLKAHTRLMTPDAQVFKMPSSEHTAKMFRADLAAAGIDFEVDGERADFHALRHSFVSNLVAAGVHPKTAQRLARHSTIALTMDRYTHIHGDESRTAVEALPDLDAKTPARTA